MNLEEWAVGGRRFGVLLVWLLMAGEVFTSFTFLGVSGWVYSRGGPALYPLVYLTLSQVVIFFLGPPLWELGRRHGLQTVPDYFGLRYGGRLLPCLVAASGIVFLIVYLQLQLTGLGIIVGITSFERIGRRVAMVVAAALVAGFVYATGVRGIARVSILKDGLLLAAAALMGLGLPWIRFGGVGPMFAALARVKPGHMVMPGATADLGHPWFISSVLLSTAGMLVWPQSLGSLFTARSGEVIRRNAILMPLYSIALFLVVFAGCAAILIVPGIKNGDLAVLLAVRQTFPAWVLEFVGVAGALTALVPAATQILAAATLFAKNVYQPLRAAPLGERGVVGLARGCVFVFTALALVLALHSSATLVALLLLAYAGVSQFLPGVLLGLYWPRASRMGVLAGLLTGLAIAAALIGSGHDPLCGVNAGFIALLANFAVALVWPPPRLSAELTD